jgi:hypothetical protein
VASSLHLPDRRGWQPVSTYGAQDFRVDSGETVEHAVDRIFVEIKRRD